MRQHLQRHHSDLYEENYPTQSKTTKQVQPINSEPPRKKIKTINEMFNYQNSYKRKLFLNYYTYYSFYQQSKYYLNFLDDGKRYKECRKSLIFMIARDKLPVSTPEKEGYRRHAYTLDSLFKPPSAKTVTGDLDRYYVVMKEKLINVYLKQTSSISLTTDGWSDLRKQSYLTVTAHFVAADIKDNKRKLLKVCLGLQPLYERHTAEYLMTSMDKILDEFQIKNSLIFAVTSDGGADIKKAVADRFGQTAHQLYCYNHGLALVVPEVLGECKEVQELIEKINKQCVKFKNSRNCAMVLNNLQAAKDIAHNKRLSYEISCATRWNSKFYMLQRYEDLLEYCPQVADQVPLKDRPNQLSATERATLKELVQLLQPLEYITRKFSGTSYPTASLVISTLR